MYFRINWINVYRKLTNVAQNVKKVASKNLKKPKVAENSKSCQYSKKLPKIAKVAEQLVAKPFWSGAHSFLNKGEALDSTRRNFAATHPTLLFWLQEKTVGQQKMACLPADRVIPSEPPFNYVGVDCFGSLWRIIHLHDGSSNSPWNCPHPSYRLHPKSIQTIHRKKGKTKTDHVWQWGQFYKGSKGLARGDSSTESRDGSCIPSPEEHEVDLQPILCLTPWSSVGMLYSHST